MFDPSSLKTSDLEDKTHLALAQTSKEPLGH